MNPSKILIIEDEDYNRSFYADILRDAEFEVDGSATLSDGRQKLVSFEPDLVLLDLKFDRNESSEGLDFLQRSRKDYSEIEVIVVSGSRRDSTKIAAILKYGAFDYLEKPIRRDVLLLIVNRALERIRLQRENVRLKENLAAVSAMKGFHGMLAASEQMHAVFDKIKKIAGYDSTVLITGETGTGKELVARAIHAESGRSPFIAIDLGTLSPELAGSELFGHAKGAFTGAVNDRKGKIEAAEAGTIFLDEIENISLDVQQKLLRLLEEKSFQRIGSNANITTAARFIVATNADLKNRVQKGDFRQDLYHRLSVFNIHIPPLRKRIDDIEVLTRYFLSIHSKSLDIYKNVLPQTMVHLKSFSWPGNVRELKNAIEEALVFGIDENNLLPEDFSVHPAAVPRTEKRKHFVSKSLKQVETEAKKSAIQEALMQANGIAARAARLLDITPRHLRRLMDEYEL